MKKYIGDNFTFPILAEEEYFVRKKIKKLKKLFSKYEIMFIIESINNDEINYEYINKNLFLNNLYELMNRKREEFHKDIIVDINNTFLSIKNKVKHLSNFEMYVLVFWCNDLLNDSNKGD